MKTVTQNTNYFVYSTHFFMQSYAHPVHNRCRFTNGYTLLYIMRRLQPMILRNTASIH